MAIMPVVVIVAASYPVAAAAVVAAVGGIYGVVTFAGDGPPPETTRDTGQTHER